MDAGAQSLGELKRFESGVPGLDEVLLGGFFQGGVNLVVGPPGSGKTILAGQIAFHHAKAGARVVYLTVLTEPHGRMIDHLRMMAFFEERFIPDSIYFVSGYRELEKDGLTGLLQLVQAIVRERRATLLILDGLSVVAGLTTAPLDLQKCMYELNTFLSAVGCTAFLLSTGGRVLAEEAMVQSITTLDMREIALRSIRQLRVSKLRGGEYLEGSHHFLITAEGARIYPRTEAVAARRALTVPHEPPGAFRRLAFGIPPLDEMLEGGIPAETSTTLLGPPGSGKTVLGTSFLVEGGAAGERGLYFGFFESPDRLVTKLDALGVPLRRHVESGAIALRWFPPVERLVDSLAARLFQAVREQRATRVFVDGVDGFRQVAADPERLPGGRHFSVFYLPEVVASGSCERELERAARTGRFEDEGWRVRKDGSRFWASVVLTAMRDPRGRLRGFAKVTRDLTERKSAQKRIEEGEQRFRALVEGVRDYAIFLLDPSGRVETWNAGAERIKGYRPSEIVGRHFSVFYPERT